jgi:hypothetical protein
MEHQHEREWVRNHKIAGYVVGRFRGEHEGIQSDLVAIQTWDGARVVPEAALIPIDKDYMIRQAGLDIERGSLGSCDGPHSGSRRASARRSGVTIEAPRYCG